MTDQSLCPSLQDLLHNVLRSPLRYFESTAHGTLLNRFSADMSRVDGWLPDDWGRVIQYSLSLFASFGVIVSVTPVRILLKRIPVCVV
jgi:ABC-type multidrug transport system fused ATPase/permease subunit